MNDFILNLNQRMNASLAAIDQTAQSDIIQSRNSIQCLAKGLQELKAYIINYRFPDEAQEIAFFKETKPHFVSRLLYHMQVFKIRSRCPKGPRTIIENYYQKELTNIESFLSEHLEFYQYYQTCCTHLDDKYFVRNGEPGLLYDESFLSCIDAGFSTSHDHLLAKIIASKTSDYLNHQIDLLDTPIQPTKEYDKAIRWTDTKANLVELIYALHATKVISGGKCDIAQLAGFFEQMLHFPLPDTYRTYLDIKARTKPTKFIDTLKTALIRKIHDEDA